MGEPVPSDHLLVLAVPGDRGNLQAGQCYFSADFEQDDSGTWLPVSKLCNCVMLAVFQILTVLSTVPPDRQVEGQECPVKEVWPAVARTLFCQGHQDTALTADWWAVIVFIGVSRAWIVIMNNAQWQTDGRLAEFPVSALSSHQPASPRVEHNCHCLRLLTFDHPWTRLKVRENKRLRRRNPEWLNT